jgi:hypothetical protein
VAFPARQRPGGSSQDAFDHDQLAAALTAATELMRLADHGKIGSHFASANSLTQAGHPVGQL